MEFQLTFAGTAGHGWEWVAAHERVVCVGENVIPLERTGNRLAGIWNNPVRRQGKQRTRTGGLVGDTEWERRVSHRELEIFAGGKRKWEKWIGSVRWLVDFWKVRFIRTKNTLCLIKENVTSVKQRKFSSVQSSNTEGIELIRSNIHTERTAFVCSAQKNAFSSDPNGYSKVEILNRGEPAPTPGRTAMTSLLSGRAMTKRSLRHAILMSFFHLN